MQQNSFPIASVIDAAQRKAQLEEQSRQSNNQLMLEGIRSIGTAGKSLYDQKVAMARALAGAQMYAKQNPEVVGENQVAQTAMGPVTNNQTANYDPATGSVTPNQSPVNVSTLASAMLGMAPKDIFDNQVQNRAAKTSEGKLSFDQKMEPQKVANEARRIAAEEANNTLQRTFQMIMGNATIKNNEAERAQAAEKADMEASKAILAAGSPLNPFNPVTFAQKREAMRKLTGGKADSTVHPNSQKLSTPNGTRYTVN